MNRLDNIQAQFLKDLMHGLSMFPNDYVRFCENRVILEPRTKQEIKDLFLELYEEAKDLRNHTGLSLDVAVRQKIEEQ